MSATALDFGTTACDAQAVSQSVILANDGTASFSFTASLAAGDASGYALTVASGIVVAGGTIEIRVTPKALPRDSVPPGALVDTLTITTDAPGDVPHEVALSEMVRGAQLVVSRSTLDFGRAKVGADALESLTIRNTGSSDAAIRLKATPPFSAPSLIVAPANGSVSVAFAFTPDPSHLAELVTASVSLETHDPVCGTAPPPIALSGEAYDLVSQASVGVGFGCAIATSDTTYCWGGCSFGQCGSGDALDKDVPFPVAGGTRFVQVAIASTAAVPARPFACALAIDGTVWCWGASDFGLPRPGSLAPVMVSGVHDAVQLSVGSAFACVLHASGTVSCWGDERWSQLGRGHQYSPEDLGDVLELSDAVAIASGKGHTCAIRKGGDVACWGLDYSYQCGQRDMFIDNTLKPTAVAGVVDAASIACGAEHTCVASSDGQVRCWGANVDGEYGDGTFGTYSATPTPSLLGDIRRLATGTGMTFGVRSNGTTFGVGNNLQGALGVASTDLDVYSPLVLGGVNAVAGVTAETSSACAWTTGGELYCWGAVPIRGFPAARSPARRVPGLCL